MIIYFKKAQAPGKTMDLRKDGNTWTLLEGETVLESSIKVEDVSLGLDHYKVIINDDGNSAALVRFADLHRHSDNSLKDGMIKIPDLVAHTEYAGALTDHGNLYGFLEFYKEMKAAGKHPIVGIEAYQENLVGKLSGNHIILLAKNNTGYKNLLKLASESYEHFYRTPHVTWDMLKKYHEGIICTSACLGGLIPKTILNGSTEDVDKVIQKFLSIFGNDFYLELQRHGIPEENVVNPRLILLSQKYSIPLIATTDSHYLNQDDAYAHEILLCLQTKKTIFEPHRAFSGSGYHIHNSAEMEQLFADLPEALDNTLRLVEQCNVEVPLGDVNLPNYAIPKEFNSAQAYFEHLCKEGFQKRFSGKSELTDPRYKERFDYEMDMIKMMGFESYFIIVWDFINYARTHNIYVGPGRGSAAGSLLAYCMGITDMDPIKFNLLFERFLNPERVSWPDIDTDIAHSGRQQVIDYITQKYGTESVCRIVTFGTMAAKMVLKDVARVLGRPVYWANGLAKLIPEDPKMTLTRALELNPELKAKYDSDSDVQEVVNIALKLEGNKRHASQHACGLVLSPGKISNFLPTSMEADEFGEKSLTSQVVMSEVEELSLIKMDLLGLKNLTAIHEVIDTVKKTRGIETTYQELPLDDRATYQMLAAGITDGVFQLESSGMTDVITKMMYDIKELPENRLRECFERLIAAVALYRPGPMDYIPNYIEGMRNPAKIHYLLPELKEILGATYGVIVYQEQVMQIVQKLAGYSLGRADVVRKAMGKKKRKIMEAEKEVFLYGNKAAFEAKKDKAYAPGCVANGISEEIAEKIWAQMDSFASYAFNRSHAACYAWLANITAYMACHWAPEFFCAMINAFSTISDKVKSYIASALRRGIKILPPDVNKSSSFCIVEDGCIRLGFYTLAHLNKLGDAIMTEREKGDFKDYQSFYERMADSGNTPGKQELESLIFSGTLDSFKLNRQQLIKMIPLLIEDYKRSFENRQLGQYSFFPAAMTKITPPGVTEFEEDYLIAQEYKSIGFYLTKHPVDKLYAIGCRGDCKTLAEITKLEASKDIPVKTYALLKNIKQIFTKNGDEMYLFSATDRFTSLPCVMFPSRVPANKHRLGDGMVVKLIGWFRNDPQHGAQIIVQDIISSNELFSVNTKTIIVSIQSREDQMDLLQYLDKNPGDVEVQISYNDKKYYTKKKINLTPETVGYLKERFPKVAG